MWRVRRSMKAGWAVLLAGAVIVALTGCSGAAAGQTPEPTPWTTIVRVYYPDLATRNAIVIAFEHALMETNYEEGYHILKATEKDIEKLRALGLRFEEDHIWNGPGSFSQMPPEEATPTSTPAP
jgi:hypothetical protein